MLLAQGGDALEGQERRVPLVDVKGGGLDVERRQRPHAADPEQDLLLQAQLAVAAVELVRDLPVGGGVLADVGVEEVERDPTYLHPPDARVELPAGELHLDHDRGPVGALLERHRQVVEVILLRRLLLPALPVERLAQESHAIAEPDSDHRQPEIAGRFQVVSGQHAESAGVDREALVEAELRGEIGDLEPGQAGMHPLVPGRQVDVAVELLPHPIHLGEEGLIGGELGDAVLTDETEELDGVVVGLLPEDRIDTAKELARVRSPGPPEVAADVDQRPQPLGDVGDHGIPLDGRHLALHSCGLGGKAGC